MNTFLQASRTSLQNLDAFKVITVVLGNQSCDLDSAISAIAYAYFLSKTISKAVIPVLNIPKDDFPLRTETNYFLNEAQVNCELLVFRNEIDLDSLCASDKLRLTLVDHHVLPAQDKHLARCVTKILDHRPQDKSVDWPEVEMTIDPVGSCCTLVAKTILDENPELLDSVTAQLLHGTIILDTINFNTAANRFKQLDRDMVSALEKRFHRFRDNKETFGVLVSARADISSLTSLQLLHKDLKMVGCLPVASLPMLVVEFAERPDAAEALQRFCNVQGTKVALVMGLVARHGTVHRDLGVFECEQCGLGDELTTLLMAHADLQLERVPCHVLGLALFRQGNVQMSRKHVTPLLQRCYR